MYIINNLLPVLVGNMGRYCTSVYKYFPEPQYCTRVQCLPILPTNPANKIYVYIIYIYIYIFIYLFYRFFLMPKCVQVGPVDREDA